jgi:hypothetical protein
MKNIISAVAVASLISGAAFADHITISGGVNTSGTTASGFNAITIGGATCKLETSQTVVNRQGGINGGCNYVVTVGNGPTFTVKTEQQNGCIPACQP